MIAKTLLVLCASALFVETIYGQCIHGNGFKTGAYELGKGLGFAGNGLGAGCGTGIGLADNGLAVAGLGGAATNGGAFTVTSSSPITPSGVSVVSEYVIEGPLAVGGQLPFLGAVDLEGPLPTGGQAGTSYGCGNGNVGIVSESLGAGAGQVGTGLTGGLGLGSGLGLGAGRIGLGLGNGLANGLGAGVGLAGRGCGALY